MWKYDIPASEAFSTTQFSSSLSGVARMIRKIYSRRREADTAGVGPHSSIEGGFPDEMWMLNYPLGLGLGHIHIGTLFVTREREIS